MEEEFVFVESESTQELVERACKLAAAISYTVSLYLQDNLLEKPIFPRTPTFFQTMSHENEKVNKRIAGKFVNPFEYGERVSLSGIFLIYLLASVFDYSEKSFFEKATEGLLAPFCFAYLVGCNLCVDTLNITKMLANGAIYIADKTATVTSRMTYTMILTLKKQARKQINILIKDSIKPHRVMHINYLLDQLSFLEDAIQLQSDGETLAKTVSNVLNNLKWLEGASNKQRKFVMKDEKLEVQVNGLRSAIGNSQLADYIKEIILFDCRKPKYHFAKEAIDSLCQSYILTAINYRDSDIEKLPDNLLMKILNYLSPLEKVSLSLVDKHWNKIIKEDHSWGSDLFKDFKFPMKLLDNVCADFKSIYKKLHLLNVRQKYLMYNEGLMNWMRNSKTLEDIAWLVYSSIESDWEGLTEELSKFDSQSINQMLDASSLISNTQFIKFVFSESKISIQKTSLQFFSNARKYGDDELVKLLDDDAYETFITKM